MTPTPATLTIGAVPRFAAGPSTALAILQNTGAAPARIVTEPGDADHGRTITPGAKIEMEPTGRFLRVASDAPTTVEVTNFTVEDLRENASAEFKVPVQLIRGKTKAAIGEFVLAYYAHEASE